MIWWKTSDRRNWKRLSLFYICHFITLYICLSGNKMKNLCFEKQLINRQYCDNWRFPDYNMLIKKMQCSQVFSVYSAVHTDSQDYDVPVSTCKFSNKNKNVLAVANENGVVCIQNMNNVRDLNFVQTHKNTVYDIAWMPGCSQFVTVSGDNSAKLWDCTTSSVNLISSFRGHKRSVRCVSFKPENTAVFATGSRDGSLMIWDVRAKKKCAKFSHHLPDQVIPSGAGSSHMGNKKTGCSSELVNSKSVTGLVFQSDNSLISCGSLDNIIRVWDMRKTYSISASNIIAKYQLLSPYSGFSYLCMNNSGTKLYVNCMDSYIYCFNINSYDPEPVAAFCGHENGSFYVKSSISFDGNYLMSGSSDSCAYIWNTRDAELSEFAVKPFVVLSPHLAEVTCVEMCSNNLVIVTCSDDGTFRLWNSLPVDDKDSKADKASCYEIKSVPVVKTQWRNKRKLKDLETFESNTPKNCGFSSHTKICRFYTVNHSSPCICHEKFTQGKGLKRLSDEPPDEVRRSKKIMIDTQKNVSQKESTHVIATNFNVNCTKRVTCINGASKRKLDNSANLIEENCKSRKMNATRILLPSNTFEKNANVKNLLCKSEISATYQNLEADNLCKENQLSTSVLCGSYGSRISSPTSNLPNYVEDGTSPYIHKCQRVLHKENDWLTKLKESRKSSKVVEDKRTISHSLPSSEPKKKLKIGDHTLYEYFKVSSKTTEKTYNLQEIQKKSILIN